MEAVKWYVGVTPAGYAIPFATRLKPTKKEFPQYAYVTGPFGSPGDLGDMAYLAAAEIEKVERKLIKPNPPRGGKKKFLGKSMYSATRQGDLQTTVIYDNIQAIIAQKGKSSLWPKKKFIHKFKKGTPVLGLSDGSILLPARSNRKLWKTFRYKDK